MKHKKKIKRLLKLLKLELKKIVNNHNLAGGRTLSIDLAVAKCYQAKTIYERKDTAKVKQNFVDEGYLRRKTRMAAILVIQRQRGENVDDKEVDERFLELQNDFLLPLLQNKYIEIEAVVAKEEEQSHDIWKTIGYTQILIDSVKDISKNGEYQKECSKQTIGK